MEFLVEEYERILADQSTDQNTEHCSETDSETESENESEKVFDPKTEGSCSIILPICGFLLVCLFEVSLFYFTQLGGPESPDRVREL